jgi:DNA-binding NtrC family response regulator
MNAVDLVEPLTRRAWPHKDGVLQDIETARASDARILIIGGEEAERRTVARLIHSGSERWRTQMLMLNAAGTSETAMASYLFETLSMTSGTLFLENVGRLTPRLQDMLYTLLNTQVRSGNATHRPFNVRLLAGNDRHMWPAVQAGAFREDLYYRINSSLIELPN